MALTPGSRLGVYEVTALIGEGGMGQVYRARDAKLNRPVALKVLPDSFAHDVDRLARFTREAQTLASFNHPNIAHLHGLEESGGVRALVMELVEGDDLSTRIARGAIPVDEALNIARQIAEALEAAHELGFVHRDLKPANIKVRADGTVKLLDFGLAKAMESAGTAAAANVSRAPTITTPALVTGAGVILGTAAYMSPEQARGRSVDRRADIWAFGCVLFEMLTGVRAFAGEDVTEVLGAVVHLEPRWDALAATVPPRVSQVLRLCLRKDPKLRAHAIGDVRLALDGAFETVAPQTSSPGHRSAHGGRRVLLAGLAVSVLGMVTMAVPTVRHFREAAALPPETRTDIATPATADPESFALSPDGGQIVFAASGDGVARLWLRSLAGTAAHPLAGTEGAITPFWSPDGRSIGFYADGRLKRLELSGGTPQTLSAAAGGRGGSWNSDNVILFSTSSGPLLRVPAAGGQGVPATTLDRQSSHRYPSFLPDGRHFIFYATGATPETTGIYVGALDSPAVKRLTTAQTSGVYLSSGWLLWVRANTLVAQRMSLEPIGLVGEPVTVADSIFGDSAASTIPVSVSASGLIAYRTGALRRRQLTWFDRSGKALGTLAAVDENGLSSPRISPDGGRVVVGRTVQGNSDIWLLDGTRTIRLTFDPALEQFPVWSADAAQIVFQSDRKGRRDIYRKSSSGAGSEDLLLESDQITVPSDYSADGRFLLYYSIDPKSARDLWALPMQGERLPRLILKTPFEERWPVLSPDGRWVAYMSDESGGRSEIFVRPFTGAASAVPASAAAQWQISGSGGVFPRWRPDGKELFYIGPAGEMLAAPIATTGPTLTPGEPVVLFRTRIAGGGVDSTAGPQYDVARDGRFLINTELDSGGAPITLLMNWNPAAAKK